MKLMMLAIVLMILGGIGTGKLQEGIGVLLDNIYAWILLAGILLFITSFFTFGNREDSTKMDGEDV